MMLAKPCIDIGMRTSNLDAMLEFWQHRVGLPYEELLKIGQGVHQHRLGLLGSVLKLNHSREPLPDTPPSGYRELLIAADVAAPEPLLDPDGNRVTLVPPGFEGVTHIGMRMAVTSMDSSRHFFRDIIGAAQAGESAFRWGTTLLIPVEEPGLGPSGGMQGGGYRYLTVQVYKVDA